MPDPTPVERLRAAFVEALAGGSEGSAVLNSAFWPKPLTPPADFDALIQAAYGAAAAKGLTITYKLVNISPADASGFTITDVGLSFFAAVRAAKATLYCRPGSANTPLLGIDAVPIDWQLADEYPAMTPESWPFTLLTFSQRFYFASAAQEFKWEGETLSVKAGQTLYGKLTIPKQVSDLFALISIPSEPTDPVISGPIAFDKADKITRLRPDLTLSAPLTGQDLKLFFIEVGDPRLGFTIETAESEITPQEGGEPETIALQTYRYFVAASLHLMTAKGEEVGMELRLNVSRPPVFEFSFSAEAIEGTPSFSPAAIIKLMNGGFFDLVPPALRDALASVQLQGFGLSGPLDPPAITCLSARIGSAAGKPIQLFTDPTNSQAFKIDSFSLAWTILNPFDAGRWVTGTLSASFELFPDIFKTKDGKPGGVFEIVIDQNLNIAGQFTGEVAVTDVLSGITGGAISLPKGVDISFSDIWLNVNTSQKAYGLGFVMDASASFPFIQHGDKPLIEIIDLVFNLGASTPHGSDQKDGKTVYAGSMDGEIILGELAASTHVDYDGTQTHPAWTLELALAQPLALSDLLHRFFVDCDLPSFIPGTLTIEELTLHAVLPAGASARDGRAATRLIGRAAPIHPLGWQSPVRPAGQGLAGEAAKQSYQVKAKIDWVFDLTPEIPVKVLADLGLEYDAGRKTGEEFSGSIIATIDIAAIGSVQIGYALEPKQKAREIPAQEALAAAEAPEEKIWMLWKGLRAEYLFDKKTVSFSLSGWTVGSLLTALVEMIGDPYFTLPSPWDLLNRISLDNFFIIFDLSKDAKYRVSAEYKLTSPLDLGLFTITSLTFRQVDGKITLAIEGSTAIPGLDKSNLFKPESDGQDVKDMPPVPGHGNSYFDLRLLALGQHIAIAGAGDFTTTKAVIDALKGIPSTSKGNLPFDPSKSAPAARNEGDEAGKLVYDRRAGWLAAMDFGVLKIPGTSTYAIDVMAVFSDPSLYGLRLALNGDKVKVLAGLAIDVLYKKITDDIGCYTIEFTLPGTLRKLDFGAFSITLPTIGLQIYTNGDFLVDFGFPYKMDFSRSFTLEAIIYGVPVLGSGGFYFGKLSNATAPNLPATSQGTFNPVIVFGLGVQIGVGRDIDKGILKAGFSITVFGIIEGMLAAWHPYSGDTRPSNEVQGDYYFKIAGTFGIIGKLYGSIDFAVIKADVSLTITVYAQITYESFRQIPLVVAASVECSVTVTIRLLFIHIKISLSFHADIREQLSIGADERAPWDDSPSLLRTLYDHRIDSRALRLDFDQRIAARASQEKIALNLYATCHTSVVAPETIENPPRPIVYNDQEGAFVVLFLMDAPVATDAVDPEKDGATSFGKLCKELLGWLIATAKQQMGTALPPMASGTVSRPLLEAILKVLANPEQAPFTNDQLLTFLGDTFEISVAVVNDTEGSASPPALSAGATMFPAPSFLIFEVRDPLGVPGPKKIDLSNYVMVPPKYRNDLRDRFDIVAANIDADMRSPAALPTADAECQSMAACVFVDYFTLLSRHLVQGVLDVFDDYPYLLTKQTSVNSILAWANGLHQGQLSAQALVAANLHYPLLPGKTLRLADITYRVQSGDTLASICARYGGLNGGIQDPLSIIEIGRERRNLLKAGIAIAVERGAVLSSTTTVEGDSFETISARLGVSIEELARNGNLNALEGLLSPGAALAIAGVSVTTQTGDTIAAISERLRVPLAGILTQSTLDIRGLFDDTCGLRFAVPGLIALPESAPWEAMLATGALGHAAGTVARYMLHGMRLPAEGLEIKNDTFIYLGPRFDGYWWWQDCYGLYQLTGQQFPYRAVSYGSQNIIPCTIPLELRDKYSWFKIGIIKFDVTKQAEILDRVVQWTKKNGYTPQIKRIDVEPETRIEPRRFGMTAATAWSTSDTAAVARVTQKPGRAGPAAADGPQVKPLLFGLSPALLSLIETNQASLAGEIASVGALLPYLPVLAPSVASTDPATAQTSYRDIDEYCFATRVDFRIKTLAQDADPEPDRPGATDVLPEGSGNSGSPAQAFAPCTYLILAPGPEQAVLLERLLTAIDSGPADLVSGLFLLHDNGAGLASQADGEFAAFIVQSNLSTETRPPAQGLTLVADTPAPGIRNTPLQFIKLLWETSAVAAGGSYLYYQMLPDGAGLPAALFDASGVATLTLLVTIGRDAGLGEAQKGARIFNAINALVTTAPIDPQSGIVDLVGVSAPTAFKPPSGTTLASLAALYGVSIGQMAASNANVALTPNKEIEIFGLYRQLSATKPESLEALAAYYSAPAVTVDAIKSYNPGVVEAPLAVFRIPPFRYRVSTASSGPGVTLKSMADYYGSSLEALAHAAADLADLFAGPPTLTVDPLPIAVMEAVGLGNAAFTLERERGAEPGDPSDIASYAKAELLQTYQLLTAGIVETPFFRGSVDSAPFGPKNPTPATSPTLGARPLARRMAAPRADDSYLYTQALGVIKHAKMNAAPAHPASGLPSADVNPYAGIGTIVQLRLAWLDLYGNWIPTSFGTPAAGNTGPSGRIALPLLYTDRLIPLDAWPNTTRAYRYLAVSGTPQLVVTLTFDVTPYEPQEAPGRTYLNVPRQGDDLPIWQRNAVTDLATFQRIYFQLNQNYDGLGVPGLAGPAVSIVLLQSLLATPDQPLSGEARAALLAYIDAVVVYLGGRASGEARKPVQPCQIAAPVAMDQIAAGNIIPLDVALALTRQAPLVAPELRAAPDGLTVTSRVPPDGGNPSAKAAAGEPPYPISHTSFATGFESIFKTADWQMRIGTSATDPGMPNDKGAPALFAVRMAAPESRAGQGIGFEIGDEARYFAPLPIASNVQTLSVSINRYSSGAAYPDGATSVTFTGIDPNVWFAECLSAIDHVLSATYATPLFLLDRLCSLSETCTDSNDHKAGYLARLLLHKKRLAAAIASTVTSVLAVPANDIEAAGDLKAAAIAKLEQSLLQRLDHANSLTCVAVLPVTKAHDGPAIATVKPPRLFGQMRGEWTGSGAKPNDNLSLSTAKIPLNASGDTSTLAFLVNSRAADKEAYVETNLSFMLSHLEHEIRSVPGIQNYEQSSWITFLSGPYQVAVKPKTGDSFAIPVSLRALPVPASLLTQTGTPYTPAPATPRDLTLWNYGFSFLAKEAAQDSIMAEVVFNLNAASLKASRATTPADTLYAALAQFTAVYPAIARDLETFVRPIDATTRMPLSAAISVTEALLTVTAAVVTAYEAWAKASARLADAVPARLAYDFEIHLAQSGADARIEILPLSFLVDGAPHDNLLPPAKVLIDEDNYEPYQAVAASPGGAVTWGYRLRKDAKNPALPEQLPYETALLDKQRAVRFEGLDLFALQNAWASVHVTRNRHLSPVPSVKTNPAFEFTTAVTRFSDPLKPLIDLASYHIAAGSAPPQPVTGWLDSFFTSLLNPQERTIHDAIFIKMETRYRYNQVSGGTEEDVPATVLPVSLLPASKTDSALGASPSFIGEAGTLAQDWFKTEQPFAALGAGFEFGLTVFSGIGDGNQPLLRIGALTLSADKIKLT